jgi:hypothetical protein
MGSCGVLSVILFSNMVLCSNSDNIIKGKALSELLLQWPLPATKKGLGVNCL